jgi:hypothetical protein
MILTEISSICKQKTVSEQWGEGGGVAWLEGDAEPSEVGYAVAAKDKFRYRKHSICHQNRRRDLDLDPD